MSYQLSCLPSNTLPLHHTNSGGVDKIEICIPTQDDSRISNELEEIMTQLRKRSKLFVWRQADASGQCRNLILNILSIMLDRKNSSDDSFQFFLQGKIFNGGKFSIHIQKISNEKQTNNNNIKIHVTASQDTVKSIPLSLKHNKRKPQHPSTFSTLVHSKTVCKSNVVEKLDRFILRSVVVFNLCLTSCLDIDYETALAEKQIHLALIDGSMISQSRQYQQIMIPQLDSVHSIANKNEAIENLREIGQWLGAVSRDLVDCLMPVSKLNDGYTSSFKLCPTIPVQTGDLDVYAFQSFAPFSVNDLDKIYMYLKQILIDAEEKIPFVSISTWSTSKPTSHCASALILPSENTSVSKRICILPMNGAWYFG